jgi:hypothetical protein
LWEGAPPGTVHAVWVLLPLRPPYPTHSSCAPRCALQMERLVSASAAVEDPLAGLLVDGAPSAAGAAAGTARAAGRSPAGGRALGGVPPGLRRRAALAYIRRLYSPFLLREPLLQALPLEGGDALGEQGMLAVWLHDDAPASNSPAPRPRLGALLLLDTLAALPRALAALGRSLEALRADARSGGAAPNTLHVALAAGPGADAEPSRLCGPGNGHGHHGRTPSLSAPVTIFPAPSGGAGGAAGGGVEALLPPWEQGVEASRAIARAVAAAVATATPALRQLGFPALSVLAPSSTVCPLRLGWRWADGPAVGEPSGAPAGPAEAAAPPEPGQYRPNGFLSAVEPVTAELLELSSLAVPQPGAGPQVGPGPLARAAPPSGKFPAGPPTSSKAGPSAWSGLTYRPSRNRQWQIFQAVERRNAMSAPLRRQFVRGLVRSLGSPGLLAASYSGDGGAVAAAAMSELEGALAGCLDELTRSLPAAAEAGEAGTAGAAAGSPARPDWTHVFMSVLPPLPLPPGGRGDVRVAAALRSAAAAAVARHGPALRASAVAVWELRLRPPQREAAWRVVVSLPTGGAPGPHATKGLRG